MTTETSSAPAEQPAEKRTRELAPETRVARIVQLARAQPKGWREYFANMLAAVPDPVDLAQKGLAERKAMLQAATHLAALSDEDRLLAVRMVQAIDGHGR